MTLIALPNLVAQDVHPLAEPEKVPCPYQRFPSKEAFQSWCKRADTEHPHVSGVEGELPTVRVSGNNPPRRLLSLVVDYDSKIWPITPKEILDRAKGAAIPNAMSRSYSGGLRLYFNLEVPVPVAGAENYKAFIKVAKKQLGLTRFAPGLDEEALANPNQYYEVGTEWTPISEKPIPKEVLWSWLATAGENTDWSREGPVVPLDRIYEEVERRWPGRWPGPFEEGARGPAFWEPTSTNPSACIVRERGVQAFSMPLPFYPWKSILGVKWMAQWEDDKVGKAVEPHWYDGRAYHAADDAGIWRVYNLEAIKTRLRVLGMSSTRPKGATASEIDLAVDKIHRIKTIDRVGPVIYRPAGIIKVNGQQVLNTCATKPLPPAEKGGTFWGDGFPRIAAFLDALFSDPTETLVYVAWAAIAYRGALRLEPTPGHIMCLGGPAGSGKTFLATAIQGPLMGGSESAAAYMAGRTAFNGELFSKGLWVVDDDADVHGIRHSIYTGRLKAIAGSTLISCEAKFRNALTTEWRGRVVICCNLDDASSVLLPDIEMSILDKLHLLMTRVGQRGEGTTAWPDSAWPQHYTELLPELACMGRYLLNYEIPEHLTTGDYARPGWGIASYHNEELLAKAAAATPGAAFGELLTLWINLWPNSEPVFEGTASEMYSRLYENDVLRPLMRDLTPIRIGRKLAQIQRAGSIQVSMSNRIVDGRTVWTLEKLPF